MNHAPTEVNPGSSVFAETLGAAPGRGRLAGRRILVVGAGQRASPPGETVSFGNGRATAVLFAREGAAVACVEMAQEAAQRMVDLITAADGTAFVEVDDFRDATRRRPNRAIAVPFGRQGTGWEVAYACLFLVSHEASYVNAEALLVDGGWGVGVWRA